MGRNRIFGVVLACIALFLAVRKLTKTDVLSKSQMVAAAGLCAATAAMASLSYGVWQDWWWAVIIFAAASVSLVQKQS